MRKRDRQGKVFIDWSQNDEHKTTVCPYSLRAATRPRIAAPVSWKELEAAVGEESEGILRFEPDDVLERLKEGGDPFAELLTLRQRLPGAEPDRIESVKVWKGTPDGENEPPGGLDEYHARRDFEKIPDAQYGAGSVIVWDFGSYSLPGSPEEPAKATLKALRGGKLEFILEGIKLQGTFLLVRTGQDGQGKPHWLLMKRDDAAARPDPNPLESEPYSVLTGLRLEDL